VQTQVLRSLHAFRLSYPCQVNKKVTEREVRRCLDWSHNNVIILNIGHRLECFHTPCFGSWMQFPNIYF
jgi:hypothetical protein